MVIADTGFWVALADPKDDYHEQAHAAAQKWTAEGFISTWPVITEASHIVSVRAGQAAMLHFVSLLSLGVCDIWALPQDAPRRMHLLMRKYADLPMDLADASLVLLAEEMGSGRILSTDERDFETYRWKSRKPFKNLLLKG